MAWISLSSRCKLHQYVKAVCKDFKSEELKSPATQVDINSASVQTDKIVYHYVQFLHNCQPLTKSSHPNSMMITDQNLSSANLPVVEGHEIHHPV